MDTPLQFTMMAAELLQAYLLVSLWGTRKTNPVFFAYSAYILTSCAVCFVALATKGFSSAEYARVYWLQTALDAAFGFATIGELFYLQRWGVGAGVTIGLFLFQFPAIRNFQVAEFSLAALAILSVIFCDPEKKKIARGLAVFYIFPAVLYLPSVPYWSRYIPVVAWIAATLLWLTSVTDRTLPQAETLA